MASTSFAGSSPRKYARMVVSSTQAMAARSLYTQGRAAWPEISVDEAKFEALADRAPDGADPAELYIACACAAADSAAIRAFETRYFTCIPGVARRLRLPDDDAGEIAQILRQRLFVGGDTAGVLGYAGSGRLAGLVQVAATRIAINMRRGRHRIAEDAVPEARSAPVPASDMAFAKAEYRDHIKQAIENAAAELEPRDRTLLRLHLVEGSSIDDVAALYRVHRATAARWIAAARQALFTRTRTRFLEATHLPAHEEHELASFVESQLTLSLSRILGD
jgi:RNA polymerase sigma-70 factor (ECF subfamily)